MQAEVGYGGFSDGWATDHTETDNTNAGQKNKGET
jgi:hypothetical protein